MKILRASDCISYIRFASWYLERIEVFEVEQPLLFCRFMLGQFVVKDRESGRFSMVGPDTMLEQRRGQQGVSLSVAQEMLPLWWSLNYYSMRSMESPTCSTLSRMPDS